MDIKNNISIFVTKMEDNYRNEINGNYYNIIFELLVKITKLFNIKCASILDFKNIREDYIETNIKEIKILIINDEKVIELLKTLKSIKYVNRMEQCDDFIVLMRKLLKLIRHNIYKKKLGSSKVYTIKRKKFNSNKIIYNL